MHCFLKFIVVLVPIWCLLIGPPSSSTCVDAARIFSFKMHHRFSDSVKNWSDSTGKLLSRYWPAKGTFEYYAVLAHRDHLLRGRLLFDATSPLSFSDGNSTVRINSLGFLHYTTVELGTPGSKFMVALDTGSDLSWVPCDCNRCAPTQGATYASDFELSIYKPEESLTGKKVTCNNVLCAQRNRCPGTFSSCPYSVSYVSAQTSTSGILVEDVLHLTREDDNHHNESVEAYVTFGCGQVQSGSFLDIAAPNGLFGLGMEKISVPSILSRDGLTADSFSMCFGRDGIGRISFGDKGSPDQEETPFNINPLHPTYNISVTQIQVGKTLIDVDFTALFDSGTSFTYLIDPIYTSVSENFHLQVQDRRRATDSKIPFEYCYEMSPEANASLIPSMSLTMKGGSLFTVYEPIIVISNQSEHVYCLPVLKSTELNILGQNFMTGYRVIFDRERLVLGWKKFDCYDIEESYTSPVQPHTTYVPPAVAAGLGDNSTAAAKQETRKHSHSSIAPLCYHTRVLFHFTFILILFILS